MYGLSDVIQELRQQLSDAQGEIEALKKTYRCYHCGFESAKKEECEAHFGDGEGESAICVAWSGMDESERLHDYQQIYLELESTRADNATLREEVERLKTPVDITEETKRRAQERFQAALRKEEG